MTREDEVTDLQIQALAPPLPYELRNMVEQAVAAWREGYRRPATASVTELAAAIADGRLRIAYQPIVDLLDHRTVALEALIRLDDPSSPDLANPPLIIDVAESSGLIGALGTHVLTTSCAQLAQWRRTDAPDLQVHVNVSALELRDPGYLDIVNRILRVCQLPANCLVLEITETVALERQGTSQRNLLALSSLGIEVALDDFGTGFASLDLLAATPTRKLKLDRSFIASVGADDDAVRGRGVIVQAAIGMGRSLGLDIVGEGIETEQQARTLLAWGCQYGQGFLFSRAVPPAELDLAVDTAPRASSLARTIDSGRLMSPEATDLALALTTVLAATDPEGGKVRHLAASAARVIAGTVGDGRKHIETSVLLAGIADAPERLVDLVRDTAAGSVATREVLDLLRIPPVIGRRTPPGAIARTAWALASARHAGNKAYDPVLLAAHPDPAIDAALRQRIDRWWQDPAESPPARTHSTALDDHFRGRDDAATRLRAFIGLARAISSTGTVDEMLDLAAEEARRVLGAASLSISRWEHERGTLRTLINVGELADWEERYPEDELYDLAVYSDVAEQLHAGEMMIESLTGPTISTQQRQMLEQLGRGSGASVPIVIEQTVWGELYVTSAIGEPPFTAADGPYLSAVAGFVGIAISRAEDVGRLARLIHEDPLTRIANRRRIEDHVDEQLADPSRDAPLALLMIDVEGLKHINNEFGHTAGDELLVRVASTLQRAAVGERHAVAGRLGGDEFCLAMAGDGEHARHFMERLQERLSSGAPPQPRLSVGIAVNHGQPESFRDLLERADTAQYAAKRRGIRIVLDDEVDALLTATDGDSAPPGGGPRDAARQQLVGISDVWAEVIETSSSGTRERLVALGELAVTLLDLNRWTISLIPPGTTELLIDSLHLRRARPLGPSPVPVTEEVYDLTDFPATAEAFSTGELAIDVTDQEADPAERALLAEHGLRYLIGVPRTDPDGTRWLLELYGDDQSLSLRSGRPLVTALRQATFAGDDAAARA